MIRAIIVLGVALGFATSAPGSNNNLLGIQPGLPLIFFDNQGTTSYTAATDLLAVQGTPVAIRFQPGSPPKLILPTGKPPQEFAVILISVGGNGQLLGGVAGNDLAIAGEVDEDGDGFADYSDMLLTGEVLQFGYYDIGADQNGTIGPVTTDVYDFRFAVTGGSLAPLFGSNDLGVVVTSEQSSFKSNFNANFGGGAKGVVGPIETLVGACCLPEGECTEDSSFQDCEKAGGIFQGPMTTCKVVKCVEVIKGACCFDDGACGVMEEVECDSAGGEYQGDNTTCVDVQCPQPEGACCFDNGGCIVTTLDDCRDQDGIYQGNFTDCTVDCPDPEGACCFVNGMCAVFKPAVCQMLGGLTQGPGTVCIPNPCPQPTGACCFLDGKCAELMFSDCFAGGGLFQGIGTDCSPNPCAVLKGACCLPNGSCAVVTPKICMQLGGAYVGNNTLCIPDPCP